jgi:hypothetical protein
MLYRGTDRVQLDAAYNNSAAAPERAQAKLRPIN